MGCFYLLKQPRWAAEGIDPNNRRVEIDARTDSFRSGLRIPKIVRPGLEDYRGSGFDRGHLVASADRRASGTLTSETVLLTNMSPQHPKLNRQAGRILEESVRDLSKAEKVVEVYAICGPLFEVGKEVTVIGDDPDDENDLRIPVPHSYFKCVLAEELKGWAFIMPSGLRDFWSEPKLGDRRKVSVRKPGQEEAAVGIDWFLPRGRKRDGRGFPQSGGCTSRAPDRRGLELWRPPLGLLERGIRSAGRHVFLA